jgi:segregation and condensation protein A
MSNRYFVKTQNFEGPLDLLLHLIKVHEIDIFKIDIFLLTESYLNYLRMIEFNDLGQAGEFLEMAATLIEIKARLLLPGEITKSADDLDDDDPVKSLQQRLIQYETFRAVADHLQQMPQIGIEIQTNHEWERLSPEYEHIEAPLTGDSTSLVILYEQMLRALGERKTERVTAKLHQLSVEEIILLLEKEILTARFALFQGYYNRFQTRYEFVAYILAMLELVKVKKLKVYQQEMFGPLWIFSPDCEEASLPPFSKSKVASQDHREVPLG